MTPPPQPQEPDNKLTIAFLKCDMLPAEVKRKGLKYEDVIHHLFEPMLPARLTLETKTYDAVARHLPTEKELEDIDAIVISGSFEDDAHEDATWILRLAGHLINVRDNYRRIRIIGICFGLQVIARAFGPSKIVKNEKGWEVGSTKVSLTPLGRELVWGDAPESKDYIMTQQIHADIVHSVPEGFELLGSSELTPVQGLAAMYEEEEERPAFYHSHEKSLPGDPWRSVHIIAFQGHPEWDERILLPLIEGYEADGAFDAEFAAAAKKRAQDHHDGKVLGRALLKVLGVGLE